MFDSVLGKAQGVTSRFGAGTSVSLVLHVAIVALALYLSGRAANTTTGESEVKFFASRPVAPPPPPPPAGSASQPKVEKHVEKKVVKKPDTIVQPKEIPTEKPPEAEPEQAAEPDGPPEGEPGGKEGGEVGGKEGGEVGGRLGGEVGGKGDGLGGTEVLRFGEGMTRPGYPTNKNIEYTREAREAHIEGTTIVECVITAEGEAKNCKIIKPLPHMEKRVLETIQGWHFTPATFEGKAVSIRYTMTFTFKLR